jgi:hypothetical protein
MAAFYQERGIDAGAMEDWREQEKEDFPFIIYHFSFVIGGFKLEVQRARLLLRLCLNQDDGGEASRMDTRTGKAEPFRTEGGKAANCVTRALQWQMRNGKW